MSSSGRRSRRLRAVLLGGCVAVAVGLGATVSAARGRAEERREQRDERWGERRDRHRRADSRRFGCCEVREERQTRMCLDRTSRGSCRRHEDATFHRGTSCADAGCAPPPKTLVIGLDGGDWRVIEPLIEAGYLPAMRRVIEGGTRAALDCRPALPAFACFCPPVWTTIATGTDATSHDIVGLPDVVGPRRHSYDRLDPAIWTLFAAEGLTSTVVSYRGAWPPEEEQTFNFTEMGLDYAASLNFVPGDKDGPIERDLDGDPLFDPASRTRPADLFERLGMLPYTSERVPTFSFMARDRVAMEALSRLVADPRYGRTDLTIIVLHSPDKSEHIDWHAIQWARRFPIDVTALLARAEAWEGPVVGHGQNWGTVASQYLEIDRWLGPFLEANAYDYVMFLSDHGMDVARPPGLPGHHQIPAAGIRALQTLYSLTGPGVLRGFELGEREYRLLPTGTVFDVVPTLLYLYGLEVPSELPGRVTLEFFSDEHLAANPVRYR